MANLDKIEEMCQQVGYEIPSWLENKTYMDDDEGKVFQGREPGGHFSGTLRELADNFFGGNDDQDMYSVIFEAAERLDDAHEMWLERKLKDKQPEHGASSIMISLDDGKIEIAHGEDGIVLARKDETQRGDWDKLWVFLTEIWGAERTLAGGGK